MQTECLTIILGSLRLRSKDGLGDLFGSLFDALGSCGCGGKVGWCGVSRYAIGTRAAEREFVISLQKNQLGGTVCWMEFMGSEDLCVGCSVSVVRRFFARLEGFLIRTRCWISCSGLSEADGRGVRDGPDSVAF